MQDEALTKTHTKRTRPEDTDRPEHVDSRLARHI